MRPRHSLAGLVLVGVVVAAWAMVALPGQATYGARVTADEPQYLLSALSLGEDLDLDISDEIAARAYEPFHEVTLDPQTSSAASTPASRASVAFAAAQPPIAIGTAKRTGSSGSWGLNSRPSAFASVWGSRVTSWNGS